MNVMEAIGARRSIRKYKPGAEVTPEQVEKLLTAAMSAPSACNSRPWEFVVVRDRGVLNKIAELHPYTKMLATASLAIIVCGRPDLQNNISEGYFPQDCGAATQNILLAAVGLGLGTCWCGVYPREQRVADLAKLLEVTSVPFNVIAVGVPDEQPGARGYFDPERVKYI